MEMKSTDWIIVVIIILLFVGAVVGISIGAEWLTMISVGLLAAIISGVVLRSELQKSKQKLIAPVSVLILGVIITGTGLIQWCDPQFLDHMLHDNDKFFGKLFMFLIGLALIVLPFAGRMRRKNCCTEAVEATCVERVKVHTGHGSYYCCTYEFLFGGKTQTIDISDHLDWFSKMKIGHEMTIWIDPVYQDEYYIPFDRNDLSFQAMLLGVFLAASALFFGSSL